MRPDSAIDLNLLTSGPPTSIKYAMASKQTKTDQCYRDISVIFLTLVQLQVKTKLKCESVDFSDATVYK